MRFHLLNTALKKSCTLVLFTLVVWLVFPATVSAAEVIKSFKLEAALFQNRQAEITETITYDFGRDQRHGIIRTIPDTYNRHGGRYKLHLEVKNVTMDNNPVPFNVSGGLGNRTLKIGDANKTITGAHVYRITYSTNRSINDQKESQEWYWNVTGNENTIPVQAASALIHVPAPTTRQVCFTGNVGSDKSDCKITVATSSINIVATRALQPSEGLTIALEFPKNTFASISLQQKILDFVRDNIPLLIPFAVLALMLIIWHFRGRDPRGRGTVIAQYEEPRALKPAMMVALLDQHIPHKAITATVLDLARRGYLKIIITEKNGFFSKKTQFTLKKKRDADEALEPFEETIFEALFDSGDEVALKDIEDFYEAMQEAEGQIFDELKRKKWFGKNPGVVRGAWIAVGVAVGLIGFFGVAFFGELFIVSSIVSGGIIAIIGWFMPRSTHEGSIVREEIEGLKKFLSVTETERLKFHNAPAKKPELFERFLPVAIALGVEKLWAEGFKDLKIEKPAYVEGDATGWNAANWVNMSNSLNDASSSSLYAAPSSAGSGSSGFSGGGSGGGFGGGSTGSW